MPDASPPRPPVRPLATFARGFAMGSADVVPGVSGGTMALILGVYERLIEALYAIDLTVARDLARGRVRAVWERVDGTFLAVLLAGIGTAIFSLARFFKWALAEHPTLVWSFFFGLVLASVWAVHGRVHRWSPPTWVALLVGAIAAWLFVGMVPIETPAGPLWFFGSGAVAICAMILPGVSGSFLLLVLGKYSQVITAISELDLGVVATVGAGCAVGILLFVRVLHWLLAHHHDLTMATLIGLMVGSLRKIWPWKETLETYVDRHGITKPLVQANVLPDGLDGPLVAALGLAVVGFVAVVALERIGAIDEEVVVPEEDGDEPAGAGARGEG